MTKITELSVFLHPKQAKRSKKEGIKFDEEILNDLKNINANNKRNCFKKR